MKYFAFRDIISCIKWIFHDDRAMFEKEFADYVGTHFALGTSFGRTALYAGLKAIDVLGGEVIISTFTCTVVRHAVTMAGATPIFVDINLANLNFNLDDLKKKISEKTKAIVLTHYFGRVARNMDNVIQIAEQNNIALIEDCAHSLGAEYKDRKIGTFGLFSIFSLTKNTINFGGGVLVTDNYSIYQDAKKILDNERISLKQRIVDFPMILAYGLEQMIDRLIFDRINKNIFKWWIIHLPHILLRMRQYIISFIKLPFLFFMPNRKKKKQHYQTPNVAAPERYRQGLLMEPLIASLARTQLCKIDGLIELRKKTYLDLCKIERIFFNNSENIAFKDVYTHMVLQFNDSDIFDTIKKCKKQGLLLRATWPTHQKLWLNQDTKNVRPIEKEILTWNVNPMLEQDERNKFIKIVNNC